MTEKQLLELKEKVADAKTQVSELTGQQTALMSQLKTDWSCKTIKEAEEKLSEMEDNIASIEKKIEKGVKELEEKYNVE
jgi:peptidoglycan hydrolase CwlO-like protein